MGKLIVRKYVNWEWAVNVTMIVDYQLGRFDISNCVKSIGIVYNCLENFVCNNLDYDSTKMYKTIGEA